MSVGNATQPFLRLLDAVCALSPHLPQPVVVQYGAAQDFACPHCQGVGFMDMQTFEQQVAGADLLILHAGAGSVIHAVRAGKVPVVMPRRVELGEHVDDHQVEFARELGRAGKIVVCDDLVSLPQAVEEARRRQLSGLADAVDPPLVVQVRELLARYIADLDERG